MTCHLLTDILNFYECLAYCPKWPTFTVVFVEDDGTGNLSILLLSARVRCVCATEATSRNCDVCLCDVTKASLRPIDSQLVACSIKVTTMVQQRRHSFARIQTDHSDYTEYSAYRYVYMYTCIAHIECGPMSTGNTVEYRWRALWHYQLLWAWCKHCSSGIKWQKRV